MRLIDPKKPTNRLYVSDFVMEQMQKIPTIEAEPVKHGRWIFTNKHLWCKDEDGNVDEWKWDAGFHNGPECQVCHTTPCVHCTPNWEETECKKGHYYCSECSETSKDAHENYCPNCGAKMDGERSKA